MKYQARMKAVAQALALGLCAASYSLAQPVAGPAPVAPKGSEVARTSPKGTSTSKAPNSSKAASKVSKGAEGTAAKSAEGKVAQVQKAAPAAPAKAPVPPSPPWLARIVNAEGNALISAPSGLVPGANGVKLVEGMRVIAPSNTNLVVEFSDGCRIPMKPNQRFEVASPRPCNERFVDLKSVLIEPAVLTASNVAAFAAPGAFTAAALSGGLQVAVGSLGGLTGLGGFAVLANSRDNDNVSPN